LKKPLALQFQLSHTSTLLSLLSVTNDSISFILEALIYSLSTFLRSALLSGTILGPNL
jgi:hypothetical protein